MSETEIVEYRCNLCGAVNRRPAAGLEREASSCAKCASTGRLRALAWLISDELFGSALAFPDFPVLKSFTALGMSDLEDFAAPLALKFNYTNTYYHKAPLFDVTKPDPAMEGKYDVIISSEVLEHVPDPVAPAFETLYRMLKPGGVLFLTVPYSLGTTTIEHFPELHDFAITQLRDQWVVVNRTRDGRIQTFDNLVFHGGPGSTLEMRVFNEATVKSLLEKAGFTSIRIAGESHPEFGILADNPWSLPIAARKGAPQFDASAWTELSSGYALTKTILQTTHTHLEALRADYARHVEWAAQKIGELERENAVRYEWGHGIEKESEEHIARLQSAVKESETAIQNLQREFEERTAWALELQKENVSLTARCNELEQNRWLRLGRRLRLSQ